jgi:HSP20 family protein
MYPDPFDEFERMRQEMERMMNDMVRRSILDAQNLEKIAADPNTCVYGFSIRVGPDGKPVVREFGNIKPNTVNTVNPAQPSLASDEREPLVDVIPTEKDVVVIAEIPGVEKHEIKLDSTPESLTISVNNPQRRYHRVVSLPCEVDPTGAIASYTNGVLEVTLKRVQPSDNKGHQIHVK